jgi:hypothetical protein
MNRFFHGAFLVLVTSGFSASVLAEGVTINGFLTTSVVMTDTKNTSYDSGAITDEARFDNPDSRLGLQFTGTINEYMDATAQLIARGRGTNDSISTDWAFVSMRANDVTQVRVGKLKLSTFLISDYIEVGYAYPWVRPPLEVYSLNPINTLVGADMLYTPTVGNVQLMIQPYLGTNRAATTISPALADAYSMTAGDELGFSVSNMAGLNVVASFDAVSFRIGYLSTEVTQSDFGLDGERAQFASAGITMDWNNIVAYAEYAMRNEDPNLEAAFPDQNAYYATLGYRVGKFLPYVTYANIDYGADESPLATRQSSVTGGLRYELFDGAALKFEVQNADPAEGEYGLFDSKIENAVLYSIALDVIF